MRKILIIDTYPINETHEKVLIDCIESLNSPELDIMVVSHTPISKEIQERVDYVVYDKENTLLPYNLTPYWWMTNDPFNVYIYDRGHSLTICKNIKTSVSLAKSLGYDFFYFLESDNIFNQVDKYKLIELSDITHNCYKKMFFFKQDYNSDEKIYETLIFGGDPSYFLDKIKLPTTIEEFIEFDYKPTLELSFYEQLNKHCDDFLILETKSSDYFNNSIINKFSQNSFKCEILKTNQNSYVLFIVNDARNNKNIDVSINNSFIGNLTPDSWYYAPINENTLEYSVSINDGEYIINKNFNLENKKYYDERGLFEFRTN